MSSNEEDVGFSIFKRVFFHNFEASARNFLSITCLAAPVQYLSRQLLQLNILFSCSSAVSIQAAFFYSISCLAAPVQYLSRQLLQINILFSCSISESIQAAFFTQYLVQLLQFSIYLGSFFNSISCLAAPVQYLSRQFLELNMSFSCSYNLRCFYCILSSFFCWICDQNVSGGVSVLRIFWIGTEKLLFFFLSLFLSFFFFSFPSVDCP